MKYLLIASLLALSGCSDCIWEKKDIANISNGEVTYENPELVNLDEAEQQAEKLQGD